MSRHEIILPDLGIDDVPTVVSLWLVREGSRVSAGEQVVEVLAGAATIDLPAAVAGVLLHTLVGEGEPISVGQRLAVIEPD